MHWRTHGIAYLQFKLCNDMGHPFFSELQQKINCLLLVQNASLICCQPYSNIALRSAHSGLSQVNTCEEWENLCMNQVSTHAATQLQVLS